MTDTTKLAVGVVPRASLDEFSAKITPPVESGLVRWEYYGDGVIPLLVDLELEKGEDATDVSPGCEDNATVVTVWHKGVDITGIVDSELRELMGVEFLEAWEEEEDDYDGAE